MEKAARQAPPFAAFQHRDFRLYELARLSSTVGNEMLSVAVGWQVYDVTHRALDLGYVGLVQFLPMLVLSLVTGHVADRFDRRRILILNYVGSVACAGLLFFMTRGGALTTIGIWPLYLVLVLLAVLRAFAGPAASAYFPSLVPPEHFGNAMAWNSSTWQVATVAGPALGGLLYGLAHGAAVVYAAFGGFVLLALVCFAMIRTPAGKFEQRGSTWERLVAGIHYVREHQILLGAISLDLFAVLLGGAAALLPVYASDILHTGPLGLGILRSAPALGAGIMAVVLAFRPLSRRAGAVMLWCVALFGVATCVFGYSRNVLLSVAALVVIGASDMVSVFVRQTLVQLETPPAMRGRVSAVSQVFIGASNELGAFESGVTANWMGPVAATVVGGVGTLLVVGLWAWRFPALRKADKLLERQPPP